MTDEELLGALEGLFAYDTGCTDSGIHDEALRKRCRAEIEKRCGPGEVIPRLLFSRMIRDLWLSEDALAKGYGIEDALSFVNWMDERMDWTIRVMRG